MFKYIVFLLLVIFLLSCAGPFIVVEKVGIELPAAALGTIGAIP